MARLEQRGDCALVRAGRLVAVGALLLMAGIAWEARGQAPDKEKAADKAAAPEKAPPPDLGVIPAGTYLEMTPEPAELRGWARAMRSSLNGAAKQMLMGNEPLDVEGFDKFFKTQVFPQFTIYSVDPKISGKGQTNVLVVDPVDGDTEAQRSRLPKMRDTFLRDFIGQGQNKVAFERLQDIAIASMSEIALKNYHPLARYNAVLLMGSLYEHGKRGELYSKVWKVLPDCLNSTGPVKVAAMNIIIHHAKSVPGDTVSSLVDRLDKLVADKTVAKGESPEAHDWIRRKAVETLTALGEPAVTAKVIGDLVAILNDTQASVELSCAAARAFGSMPASALGTLDLSTLSGNIGRVAVTAVRAELARAEQRAFAAPLPVLGDAGGNSGYSNRRGPAAAAPADAADSPATPSVQYISIPLVKSQLQILEVAFKGTGTGTGLTAAGNGTNHKQSIDRVAGGLAELIAVCDDRTAVADYEPLKQKLERSADNLEGKLGGKVAVPAAPPGKAGSGSDPFGDALPAAPEKGPKAAPPATGPAKEAPAKTAPAKAGAGK